MITTRALRLGPLPSTQAPKLIFTCPASLQVYENWLML